MRDLGDDTNAYLTTPGPRAAELLIWVKCRNRDTGTVQPVGLWTGPQAADFTIDAETRTYYGAGAVVSVPAINCAVGLDVRLSTLKLSRWSPAVELMLDTRDPRHAAIEIRRAVYDLQTGVLVAEPAIVFDGFVDTPEARSAGIGGAADVDLKIAPVTAALSLTSPLNYADETARMNADDRILRYASVSGQPTVWWGEKRAVTS